MKRYLNTRTNKGGGRSKCKSKLRPIANLFLRRLIWTFGVFDQYDAKTTYVNGSTIDSDIFDMRITTSHPAGSVANIAICKIWYRI